MKISSAVKRTVANATFRIKLKKGGNGQCVFVEGGLVITAAHCVEWDCNGMMTMGDYYLNKIVTDAGDMTAVTLAVEPVSDVAILGSPDPQTFFDQSEVFDLFCERIKPLKLQRTTPKAFEPFPVWIRTHSATWVAGKATHFGNNSTFSYTTEGEIRNGTSGGPIVNNDGELVGVVSFVTNADSDGEYTGGAGLLSLALPAWVLARAAA